MGMIHPKVFCFSHRLQILALFEDWANAHQAKNDLLSFLAFLQTYHLLNLGEAVRLVDPAFNEPANTGEAKEEQKAWTIEKKVNYEVEHCSYPVVFGVYGEFAKKRMEFFPMDGGKLDGYTNCFDCEAAFEEKSLLYLASVKNHKNVLLCGKCAPKYRGEYRWVDE